MKFLRLSLRELFLVVALVAVACGWWVHVQRLRSEVLQLQTDLLAQSDFVGQFASVLTKLGCEIPSDSDPRCANGGPYTRIFVPQQLQAPTGCISFTLSGSREQLQRTIDGEFQQFRR